MAPAVKPDPRWHVVAAAGPYDDDNHTHRLELVRGEGDAAEHAYVDVGAWEDRHGDARIEVLGEWPAGDVLGREAADALRGEPEHALAAAVLDGRAYVLDARRAA
jgi:hypothetical protein